MKNAPRYLLLVFAIVAVVVILAIWKKNERERALAELDSRYDAVVSITEDDFYLGCASDDLVDLVALAELASKVGEPTILDLTGASKLESFEGAGLFPKLRSLVAIDCPALVSADGVSSHPTLLEIVLTDSASFANAAAIREIPQLETLDFSGCLSLESVDVSSLSALKNLYLSRCRRLEALDVASAGELRQLYLDGCAALESIEGLGRLVNLTDLDVSNATGLRSLDGVDRLHELIVLDIRNVELDSFREMGGLPNLRVLRLGGQEGVETLEPFSGLAKLREIHLEACPNFESIEGLPATVSQYAGFTHCPKLTSMAGVEAATELEQLDLTGCVNLEDVSQVARLENLVQLSLVKCRRVTDIASIEDLEKLVIVMLGGSGVVPAAVEDLEPANEEIIFDFAVSE